MVRSLTGLILIGISSLLLFRSDIRPSPCDSSNMGATPLEALPMDQESRNLLPEVVAHICANFQSSGAGLTHAIRLRSALDVAREGKNGPETFRLVDELFKSLGKENCDTDGGSCSRPSRLDGALILTEKHRGELLSTLGEAGVPADHAFSIAGTPHKVDDLVRGVEKDMSLEGEFEWQAVALALYRPDVDHWRNAAGDEITWDKIGDELVLRTRTYGRTGLSCAGTHVLYCLATLVRVDQAHRFWSDQVRSDVRAAVRRRSDDLQLSQLRDGSWGNDWSFPMRSDVLPADSVNERLLITGHHLEWIALVDADCRPTSRAIERAGHFVLSVIAALRPWEIRKSPCACSHGVRAHFLSSRDELL